MVSLHLDGGVLHWHKNLVKTKGRMPEWEEYKEAIRSRFGILAYHDPMAEMKKLKQTGTLQEYLMAFDALMDKAQLSEEQALSCFLAGLKHELEMVVRMFNPKKLQEAYSLAKLQDALKNDPTKPGYMPRRDIGNRFGEGQNMGSAFKNFSSVGTSSNGIGSKGNSVNTVPRRTLNLTPKQLEEKRMKN